MVQTQEEPGKKLHEEVAGKVHEILYAALPHFVGCTLSRRLGSFIPTAQGADLPAGVHQAATLSHQQSQSDVFKNTIAAPPAFLGGDTPLLQAD